MVLKKNCAVYVTLTNGTSINYKLNCNYAPHCPSFDVYLIHTTFLKLAIIPPLKIHFHYSDTVLLTLYGDFMNGFGKYVQLLE